MKTYSFHFIFKNSVVQLGRVAIFCQNLASCLVAMTAAAQL